MGKFHASYKRLGMSVLRADDLDRKRSASGQVGHAFFGGVEEAGFARDVFGRDLSLRVTVTDK